MSSLAAGTEPQPEETVVPETRASGGGVRLRALIIGFLMVVLIVGMTQVLSLQRSAAEVGGGAPAPAPTYLLFFYVLLLAPLLSRVHRRLALSRGELLLIYGMMLVAGPITHQYAMGFLIPHTVAPLYYNAQEPGWALFRSVLPSWFAPTDPAAVKTFFQGGDGTVPWLAWLVPMTAWCSLLIALFFVMLCINVLVRRQWADSERLTFPLAAIPLALTETDARADGLRLAEQTEPGTATFLRHPVILFRRPLFWLGLIVPLALRAPGSLHRYVPSFPELPLQGVILLDAGKQLTPPWNGLGQVEFDLIFWLLGVAYLLPKEITFSAWAFYLIQLMENVVAVWRGTTGEAPNVYSNDFPAIFSQGAGAALALTGITLWTARRHLRQAFRRAFAHDSVLNDIGEFLSYRTAFVGAFLGIAFLIGWCWLAGMRLWVAALLFGFMLTYFFIFTRIRAETGLGMGVILWPKMLDEMMITVVGAKYLTLSDLTVLHALRWLYFGSATGSVMACQLESFKLADSGGLCGRRVGWALALAATIATPLAFAWTLKTFYASGFEALPIGQRSTSMVGSQIYWSYQNLVAAHDTASGPEWAGLLAIGVGALVTIALSSLRMRFLWFPLHPVGYLAANSWGMHINWITFLLGWLLNVVITRYGGMKGYRRLLPLFFGLIVGDMLHEGVWGMVAWLTGGRM